MATKYVFVTGGVVSGLGKGITAAVLGCLLKARGLTVQNQKFDPYINVDPALMSPIQHGEIFITEDGAETDLDIGHYERFTDENLTVESDITSGTVYLDVISRERQGGYNGRTVQVVPHIINEIKEHIFNISRQGNPDVVICEIGGTVGDMESQPFIEAIRQVSYQVGRENCLFMHVTLLPYLTLQKEIKTKPTQHSVKELLSYGVQPDILVCRTEVPLDADIRRKIALYCNVKESSVIQNLDCETVYALPLIFEKDGLAKVVCEKLGIAQYVEPDLSDWKQLLTKFKRARRPIRIALVGKYTELPDAYYSTLEAIMHASIHCGADQTIEWVASEELEGRTDAEVAERLKGCDAVIVPGGFGPRGMEGMIRAARHAREHNIPYLGIGLGMQMAVVEFARSQAGISDAHSDECEQECSDIFYYAGLTCDVETANQLLHADRPMRRGANEAVVKPGTLLASIYQTETISERHHHRRELNPAWQGPLLSNGLIFSATSPDGHLIEAIEIPNHPFFLGVIYHPEFKSRPTRPHTNFKAFIRAPLASRRQHDKVED